MVGISQEAFAKTPGVKKVTLKTSFLEKEYTRGCLLSSKVKTVVVKIGSASENKVFRRFYSSLFKKNHCGKKVKLK